MKLYLITLTISLIALYAYVKQSYKYASVNDAVEPPNDIRGLKQGDVYKDKSGNQVMLTSQPPIDYESDKIKVSNSGRRIVQYKEIIPIDYEETQAYKDNEVWFTGMGRC